MAVDVIRSTLYCYPDALLWILDDATNDGTFAQLELYVCKMNNVKLLRNANPRGYKGIAVSTFRLLEFICKDYSCLEFLVVMDPDVCILRKGIEEFARQKFQDDGPGILGACDVAATGRSRSHQKHRKNFWKDILPLGVDDQTRNVRLGFPFYLKYLPRAWRHGYRLGRHILSSFYVIHGQVLYENHRNGYWRAIPDVGSRNIKADDPLVSLGAYVSGCRLIEIHQSGTTDQRAWIQYEAPLAQGIDDLCASAITVVHPIKDSEENASLREELHKHLAGCV